MTEPTPAALPRPTESGRQTTVTELLVAMRGVWVDHLEAFHPDGTPMNNDPYGGKPGPFPYDNLVYVDLNPDTGEYKQSNVTFRGRELHVRSFSGQIGAGGLLHFAKLGPNDPGHIGTSGGPGVLWLVPCVINHESVAHYTEPDHIRLLGANQRTRVTVLYRDGQLVRTMTASGTRVSDDPTVRVSFDPRGPEGPVHHERYDTQVFSGGNE